MNQDSNYIINCTHILNLEPDAKAIFNQVSTELTKVREMDKSISEIGIAGGFVIDTLLNLEPADIDLKYAIKDEQGNTLRICKCDHIKTLIEDTILPKKYSLDIGSIKENNNDHFESINDKHLGIFSHHPEYISQFVMDETGNIWSNKNALKDYFKREYNPSTEGLMCWIYYENRTFFEALALMLIRGFGYIDKRDLQIGEKFYYYMEKSSEIFEEYSKEDTDHKSIIEYFNKKVGTMENLSKLLDKHKVPGKHSVLSSIEKWSEKYTQ